MLAIGGPRRNGSSRFVRQRVGRDTQRPYAAGCHTQEPALIVPWQLGHCATQALNTVGFLHAIMSACRILCVLCACFGDMAKGSDVYQAERLGDDLSVRARIRLPARSDSGPLSGHRSGLDSSRTCLWI